MAGWPHARDARSAGARGLSARSPERSYDHSRDGGEHRRAEDVRPADRVARRRHRDRGPTPRQVHRPRDQRSAPGFSPSQSGVAALVRRAQQHPHPPRQVPDRAARRIRRRVGVRPDRGGHQEVARLLRGPGPLRRAGRRPARPRSPRPDVRSQHFRRPTERSAHPDQGCAPRSVDHRRSGQRVLRRDPPRCQDVSLCTRSEPQR